MQSTCTMYAGRADTRLKYYLGFRRQVDESEYYGGAPTALSKYSIHYTLQVKHHYDAHLVG